MSPLIKVCVCGSNGSQSNPPSANLIKSFHSVYQLPLYYIYLYIKHPISQCLSAANALVAQFLHLIRRPNQTQPDPTVINQYPKEREHKIAHSVVASVPCQSCRIWTASTVYIAKMWPTNAKPFMHWAFQLSQLPSSDAMTHFNSIKWWNDLWLHCCCLRRVSTSKFQQRKKTDDKEDEEDKNQQQRQQRQQHQQQQQWWLYT